MPVHETDYSFNLDDMSTEIEIELHSEASEVSDYAVSPSIARAPSVLGSLSTFQYTKSLSRSSAKLQALNRVHSSHPEGTFSPEPEYIPSKVEVHTLLEFFRRGALFETKETEISAIFSSAVNNLVKEKLLSPLLFSPAYQALIRSQEAYAQAVGEAFDFSLGYVENLDEPLVAVTRLEHPVNFDASDNVPTKWIFVFLLPLAYESNPVVMVSIINTLTYLMSLDAVHCSAFLAPDLETFLGEVEAELMDRNLIAAADCASPKPKKKDVGFSEKTRRAEFIASLSPQKGIFGEFIKDCKRFGKYYKRTWTNAWNGKLLASIFFIFFAVLAPAVSFGAIIGEVTENAIGVNECLISAAVLGIFYAIFGNPLIVIGATGPILVFTRLIMDLSKLWEVDFLQLYGWISVWTGVCLIIIGLLGFSTLMRYATRFLDEIFSSLIGLIFIYEAIKYLIKVFSDHEVYEPETAWLTLVLQLGTLYLSRRFVALKKSKYLSKTLRTIIADLGTIISIILMTTLDVIVEDNHTVTDKLILPSDVWSPTSGRDWLVPLFDMKTSVILLSILPALLQTVLVVIDHNITVHLVYHVDNKCMPPVYSFDLIVIGITCLFTGPFGLVVSCGATVRSINLLFSQSVTEIMPDEDGKQVTRVIKCYDNRVSNLVIHILVFCALLASSIFKYLPLGVLQGVFLSMGISTIINNQLFERVMLLFQEKQLHNVHSYLRTVCSKSINIFTIIQVLLIGFLWLVKSSAFAIVFPIVLLLLPLVRFKILPRFIPENDLAELDREEEAEDHEDDVLN
ncbi:hypothetical protein PCE1_000459 [Barthelona sp. PCE]